MKIHIENTTFDMIHVQGGTFHMGSNKTLDPEAREDETPHLVRLTDIHIGQYPVTQALWRAVVEADCPDFKKLNLQKLNPEPSSLQGDMRPVEQVSWDDVQVFLKKLNLLALVAANHPVNSLYRLPTEAEWEYAARGGRHSEGYRYAGSDKLSEVGWFAENSESETHEVGLLMPNELGLYDMSGNVWEWCSDWFDSDYYKNSPLENPQGPSSGSDRVMRGGSWDLTAQSCRAAFRYDDTPVHRWHSLGFRLVLAPQSVG